MKPLALLTFLVLLGGWASADPKPYDTEVIKQIMYSNGSAVSAVNKALKTSDWKAAAEGFATLEQNAKKALEYAAPRGNQKEWVRIWNEFLASADLGAGAVAAKDAPAAKKFLDQITGDRNQGHSQFKG